MIDAAARPITTLDEPRDRRRAVLEPWLCEGILKDGSGRACRKVLMELDYGRPSYIRKKCDRCGYSNVFVEAYRPV